MHPVRFLIFLFFLIQQASLAAHAAGLLRDADIEHSLAQIAQPVLSAAGLSSNQIKILVVNDNSLNAFVADSQHIFLNVGLILKLGEVGMLQAVIAHEAAHIANGHLARRTSNFGTSKTAAGLGMLLAAATALSGNSYAAAGIALGTNSTAQRLFFTHTRAEEAAADQSGIRYMVRADIDPQAAVELLNIFEGQDMLSPSRQDPYARSHPRSRDRNRTIKNLVSIQKKTFEPDLNAQYWFKRAKGKLSAFIRSPKWTFQTLDDEQADDIRLMRKAVAYFRRSDLPRAKKALEAVIKLRPDDGYIYDLYGEILLKGRAPKQSIQAYQTAVSLVPENGIILGGLGRALLADGRAKSALPVLEKARSVDFGDTRVLRDLALAYAKTNQTGMASLVTAERYALQGRIGDALIHSKRAEGLLPKGSGPWKRAMDIQNRAASQK